MAKNIIVTGATGKQGGALISALLAAPSAAQHVIYAVTRNPASAAARRLASISGVSVVRGDLDSPAAIFAAVGEPVWGVFSVQVPFGGGATAVTEERQGEAADCGSRRKVKKFLQIAFGCSLEKVQHLLVVQQLYSSHRQAANRCSTCAWACQALCVRLC